LEARVIQTIAVVNMKGGVGKSTATVALTEILASRPNCRVLAIDLDPQANTSLVLTGIDRWTESRISGRTIDAYFGKLLWDTERPDIGDLITPNVSDVVLRSQIDALITTPEFRYTEREAIERLVEQGHNLSVVRQRIANSVRRIRDQANDRYKYVIIDCPPGISYFAEAALLIADLIVIPTIPDVMSQFGLNMFIRRVLQPLAAPPLLQRARIPASRICVLISKHDAAIPLHAVETTNIRAEAKDGGFTCLEPVIPQDQHVARAAEYSDTKRSLEQKYGKTLPLFRSVAEHIVSELAS